MLSSIASVVHDSVRQSVMSLLESGIAQRADGSAEGTPAGLDGRLTRRQRDVFALLGEGKTNLEIAEALAVSPNTVKLHVSAILRRLELDSRTQAALMAAKLGR
jgi:DNA-binding NarL/FixJ family response regulator